MIERCRSTKLSLWWAFYEFYIFSEEHSGFYILQLQTRKWVDRKPLNRFSAVYTKFNAIYHITQLLECITSHFKLEIEQLFHSKHVTRWEEAASNDTDNPSNTLIQSIFTSGILEFCLVFVKQCEGVYSNRNIITLKSVTSVQLVYMKIVQETEKIEIMAFF